MTLHLVAPDGHSGTGPLSEWLGGRSGRVHHLGLSTEEPARIADARPIGADEPAVAVGITAGDGWVVEPEANAGMRLVLAVERIG